MKKTVNYYPLLLNISGKRCVVIGGGRVAFRKVKRLLECGCRVKVISPKICNELCEISQGNQIHICCRPYKKGDLKNAFLAFAATDDVGVNKQIAKEAGNQGILVNIVDDADESDFIVPASARKGAITLAVSTNGISPALARKIRTKLKETISDEYTSLLNVVGDVRTELKKLGVQPGNEDWQKALDLNFLLEMIKKGNNKKARDILLDNLRSHNM